MGAALGMGLAKMPDFERVLSRSDLAPYLRKHHRHALSYIEELMAALPPDPRIADVGCGPGVVSALLRAAGARVSSVDKNPEILEAARRLFPEGDFRAQDAEQGLSGVLGEAAFDAVVSLEVIEHVYAPARYLAQLNALLKPGGALLLSTPYHGYLKNLALSLSGRWDAHFHPQVEGGHIKFFSPGTLAALVEAAGFRVTAVRGAGRAPWLWESMFLTAVKSGG
jgi:2-polyprenyl-6-hydroxyphenyl methylase/3-demethylubiquinone-9 3-methyltransferase